MSLMKMGTKYDPGILERKWESWWREKGIYEIDLKKATKPYFNLMMFPYPSAEGLHVGNMMAFVGADIRGRFMRMRGFDVFEPMGLDGFGIHSENYAIKVGRHPKEHARISEEHFYSQLSRIGNGYAWNNRLETYDPEYYRFTQWLFTLMYKRGLAYKAKAKVNWCPSCKTVLADEQVENGICERCKSEVERREMSSWHFAITKYADRLLLGLEKINWPAKIKTAQRNWIGKDKGLEIDFEIEGLDEGSTLTVWTKYWETIFGATFLVVAPEVASKWMDNGWKPEKIVVDYVRRALNKTEQQRKIGENDKTGVNTGLVAINPVNGEKVPVFVADYVISGVGTGAVMGVPAHDNRDFDFAKKFDLPIRQVVAYAEAELNQRVARAEQSFEGEGVLMNSARFDGLDAWGDGKEQMADWMIKDGFARWKTVYHLRDWLISRQRYWGAPIPMLDCPGCGWVEVPFDQLPVVLPDIVDFRPKGDGSVPLSNASKDWKEVACPKCGKLARRELGVCDTFLDSSWYFLGYLHMNMGVWVGDSSESRPFDQDLIDKWTPVSSYIGGAEHAVLHLLYARFVNMVLFDAGLVNSEEPFPFLYSHGLILKDGAKMSKSRGNIVNPDEYMTKFGADCLRCYLMFLGPYDQGGDFRDSGMAGMRKFLDRVYKLFSDEDKMADQSSPSLAKEVARAAKAVREDLDEFKYNTAISELMKVVNVWKLATEKMGKGDAERLIKLFAVFAPHLAEEIYQNVLNHQESVHKAAWPDFDTSLLVEESKVIVVQVNGKVRASVMIDMSISGDKAKVVEVALQNDIVRKWIPESTYKEVFFVPGRLVNFVLL